MMLVKESGEAEIIEIKVREDQEGSRLDSAIADSHADLSRNRAQTVIESGDVTVNEQVIASKKAKVSAGDNIRISIKKEIPLDVEPEKMDLDIIYEDSSLVVVNKPKGMVVHPAPGNLTGTLVNGLLYHCKDSLSSINGVIRPGIVHRIDKDTTGLLVVAKNDEAHKYLSRQLADHSMEREYHAIVYNNIKEDEGTVDLPIGRDPKNRLRNKVIDDGRNAVTHYRVLERFGKYTYVSLNLETGRTHQIRVHMAHIGHPLLGDSLYSGAKNSLGAKSQVLHAKTLGFIHPSKKTPMKFNSPLPEDFEKILKKLKTR